VHRLGEVRGTVFTGQMEGIRQVDNQIRLVSCMDHDLGFFDKDEGRIEPGPYPFRLDKVLTMCPVRTIDGGDHVAVNCLRLDTQYVFQRG